VRRVLSRYYDIEIPVDSSEGVRLLQSLADRILPPGEAGDHNQAVMELGALVCRPKDPDCAGCPLREGCRSRAAGTQLDRPVMKRKKRVPSLTVTAAVIRRDDRVLITQRPEDGLLGGMWEFPGGKQEDGEDLTACLAREIREELGAQIDVGEKVGIYRHAYTHFKVELHAFECRLVAGSAALKTIGVADFRWVKPAELEAFPMGKIDRAISIDIRE
jgi:A/G-specific adenine glycosylase